MEENGIRELLSAFLLQLDADGRSDHTRRQYERHIRVLADWLEGVGRGDDLNAIGHQDIARFLVSPVARLRPDGVPKKPTSMNAMRSSIRTFFGYCHKAGWIERDPAALVRRAACSGPTPKGLSAAEEERLLEVLDAGTGAAAERDRVLFTLMLRTGLRLGETLGLDVADVDCEAGELTVRKAKGGRQRVAVMPKSVAAMLPRQIGDRKAGPLFLGRHSQRVGARCVRQRLRMAGERAGLELHPHRLRHTFAAQVYGRTGDVLITKEALGHRSVQSTLIYTHAIPARLHLLLERCGPEQGV